LVEKSIQNYFVQVAVFLSRNAMMVEHNHHMLIIVVIVIKVSKNKKFAEILDKQGNCDILIDILERKN